MKNNRYNNFSNSNIIVDISNLTADTLTYINKGAFKDNEKNAIHDYCKNAINSITYTEDEQKIYDFYMNNIMQHLKFEGGVVEDDVRTVIQYLGLKKIKEMNLRTNFEILPDYLYTLKFGLTSVCGCRSRVDGSSVIYLRGSSFKRVLEDDGYFNQKKLYVLLVNLYHEIMHAHQSHVIHEQYGRKIEDKEILMWIKEYLIDDYDKGYYVINYKNMYIERYADVKGRFMAIDSLHQNFRYFSQKLIASMEHEALDYKNDTIHLKHLDPATHYREAGDALYVIDSYIDKIALKHPDEVHEQLSIQYHADGQRRSSNELTNEYYERKLSAQATFKIGTPMYEIKMNALRELYDYLICSVKENEVCPLPENHKSKIKGYKNRVFTKNK